MRISEQDLRSVDFELSVDKIDSQTVLCKYPKIFESNYLTRNMRLEIESLAAWAPAIDAGISSTISEAYPNAFKEKTNIGMVSTGRIFWEKATILHHETDRPEASPMPHRYARYFYDLYKIASSDFENKTLKDKELLRKMTGSKMKFHPRKRARYEDALSGRLKLALREFRFPEIKKDYKTMEEMIYGEYPKFDEVIKAFKELGKEINR